MQSLLRVRPALRRSGARATLLAGALLAAGAVPAAAQTSVARPRLEAPQASLVRTGGRSRVVVTVPTTHDLRRLGNGVRQARVRSQLDVRIWRLAGQKPVRVTETRRTSGASLVTVRHRAVLGARASDVVRRVIEAGGEGVRVVARARVAVDADGNGRTDATATATRAGRLHALTPFDGSAALLGHQPVGTTPCEYYTVPNDNCINVQGKVWEAGGLWHSNTQKVDCPSDYVYATATGFVDAAYMIDTTSSSFTNLAAGNFQGGQGLLITITDDNLHGHPIAYTPYVACEPKPWNPDGAS